MKIPEYKKNEYGFTTPKQQVWIRYRHF